MPLYFVVELNAQPYVRNDHKFTSVEEGMRLGQILDNHGIRKSREMDTSVTYHIEKPTLSFIRFISKEKIVAISTRKISEKLGGISTYPKVG